MATKVIGKLVLYEPMDQEKITDMLAGSDVIVFEVQRQYKLGDVPELLGAVLPVQFSDPDVDYVEAMMHLVDIATWQHQEGAVVYRCDFDAAKNVFDFTNSYIRDLKNTSLPKTAIETGRVLNAIFTTPGLDGVVKTIIELPYNEPISVIDIAKLEMLGLTISLLDNSGSFFAFSAQKVPYKVEFIRPESVTDKDYIIDFDLTNKVIEL